MGIRITADPSGVSKALLWAGAIRGQLPYAMATAMNKYAYETQQALRRQTTQSFVEPVPFTKRGFFYTKATKTNLSIAITPGQPGNKSDPRRRYISRQVFGGVRARKASEYRAARDARDGSLAGMRLAPTKAMRPHLTKAGNVPKSFWERLPEFTGTRDREFFIGKPRHHANFPAGIWLREGRKLTLFMSANPKPTYSERFPMREIGERNLRLWPEYLTTALSKAIATARR